MTVDASALWLTLRLAASTTLALLILGLPLAQWLARSRWRGKFVVEAAVALPIVLPPTVIGFYILMMTGPRSALGSALERWTGATLPFSFAGLLVASVVYNLPFAVRPFATALASVDARLLEASWCLGVSRWETFFHVSLPLAWPGILSGLVLTFAHTVGEFGVVLMVGGNIPRVTRTLSITIYDDVQALDYASAGRTSLFLLLFCFVLLAIAQSLQRRAVGP